MLKIQNLLNQKWVNLLENYKNLDDSNCPGVYILAFTDKDLEGKPIKLEDIYYVGMTNSRGGLKQRLKQFINGIHKGYGHSAGNRFFKENSNGKSFDSVNHKEKFL